MISPSPQTNPPKFQNHSTLPIAIIGGGLSGLALAIGLVARGIDVHIYESAPAFSEIGAGVTSGVNAVVALHLLDSRLLAGYRKHATFNADPARSNTFISLRWGTDGTTAKGDGHKAGDSIFNVDDRWNPERAQRLGLKARSCIHRARLLEELVALLPEDVTTFGKSFVSAEELQDGTLQIHFADGTNAMASAVIGCDGIKSRVREFVCGSEVKATYAEECAFRAVVPREDAIKALGEEGALNGHIYCGHGGYIITYPIEHGDFINIVLMPHDSVDQGFERRKRDIDEDEWTAPAHEAEFRQHFEGWYSPLIEVASRFLLPTKWLLHDLRHNAPYYKSRICLMGDAAHATTPHLGTGAGMAMEDAYILSSLIASVSGVSEVEKAFRAYDAARRSRTQECVKRSLDAALGYGFLLEGVGNDLSLLKDRLKESYEWVWNINLEEEVEKAKRLL